MNNYTLPKIYKELSNNVAGTSTTCTRQKDDRIMMNVHSKVDRYAMKEKCEMNVLTNSIQYMSRNELRRARRK